MYKKYAEDKEKEGRGLEFMPPECFIQPISVKSYLKYTKYYDNFDFARYSDKSFKFEELNNISVPLFMRWGNVNEMIEQDAKELINMLNEKITIPSKDINYIEGADHSYSDKEEILAKQIVNFLN